MRPPRREAVWLADRRHRNCLHHQRLTAAQFRLLHALRGGAALTQACERTLAACPDTRPKEFQKWVANWAVLGWFWLERPGAGSGPMS
ncbi:MAG: hypothetical protein HZA92_12695 [Verrucomicrobia bacterium]|nr:hypothetical protein [Verrucomicrobiota bacterium]